MGTGEIKRLPADSKNIQPRKGYPSIPEVSTDRYKERGSKQPSQEKHLLKES
jgi:hypothetical protein